MLICVAKHLLVIFHLIQQVRLKLMMKWSLIPNEILAFMSFVSFVGGQAQT